MRNICNAKQSMTKNKEAHMAITKRCDRCGRHMESGSAAEIHVYMDEKRIRPVEIELCRECKKSLEEWFESGATALVCTISAKSIAEASANAMRSRMGGDAR